MIIQLERMLPGRIMKKIIDTPRGFNAGFWGVPVLRNLFDGRMIAPIDG